MDPSSIIFHKLNRFFMNVILSSRVDYSQYFWTFIFWQSLSNRPICHSAAPLQQLAVKCFACSGNINCKWRVSLSHWMNVLLDFYQKILLRTLQNNSLSYRSQNSALIFLISGRTWNHLTYNKYKCINKYIKHASFVHEGLESIRPTGTRQNDTCRFFKYSGP